MRVISADCHINEPPEVFDRVPAEYRDRAPKMKRGLDGGDGWSFDDGPPKRTFGIEAMAGRARADYQVSGLRFDEILRGNWDPHAHAADMDLDGIDVSVVYPASSIFIYVEPDRALALACMRSYNDWVVDDFQGGEPERIVGLAMLPVDDGMDACLAEFDRIVAKGARGLFIPGMPDRPYHDPYYEPLWSRASDTGVPLTFHRTFGGRPKEQDWDELMNQNVQPAGTVFRFFSGVRALTYMTFAGVFARHPGLKLIAAEVNFGWVPFWAQTMDQQVETQSGWADIPLDRMPSQYLGHNVFVTVLDDHVGFDLVRTGQYPYLADMAMFSSDYPHSVTLWPRSQEHISKLTTGIRDEDVAKILSGNAARVYAL